MELLYDVAHNIAKLEEHFARLKFVAQGKTIWETKYNATYKPNPAATRTRSVAASPRRCASSLVVIRSAAARYECESFCCSAAAAASSRWHQR